MIINSAAARLLSKKKDLTQFISKITGNLLNPLGFSAWLRLSLRPLLPAIPGG